MRLGERDGEPLFTLTSFQTRRPAPPSAAYLRTILTGLAEVTDWSVDEQAAYLLRARGVAPAWDSRPARRARDNGARLPSLP